MTPSDDPMHHEDIDDELAELALGLLDGRRRAELLTHVESCGHCLAQVERFAMVADQLVHIAPELEPPLGFENGIFDRIREAGAPEQAELPSELEERRRRRSHPVRVAVVAAIAAAMALLGVGAGWALHGTDNVPPSATSSHRPVLEGRLLAAGHSVGDVYVSAGQPAWLTMNVRTVSAAGMVQCNITTAGGGSYVLGYFQLLDGNGSWDTPLPVAPNQVERAQLLDQSGQVLATATLRAPPVPA
jgi:anti-sigma factor RsiW